MYLTQEQQNQISTLHSLGFSSRKIAKTVLGRSSRKSTVTDFLTRKSIDESQIKKPKILLADIETSFAQVGAFGRFNINVGEAQVFEHTKLLGMCAKWLSEDEMIEIWPERFEDWNTEYEQKQMLSKAWRLIDEADYIIGHNYANFDSKMLNAYFVKHGFSKPSPYKIIDTLKIARQNFRFDSNKLDSLGAILGVGRKVSHTGMDLWMRCFKGEKEAFLEMLEYCNQDVLLLEEIYMRLRSWDSKHPNISFHCEDDGQTRCPICASTALTDTGKKAYTNANAYSLLKCVECGGWHRSRNSEKRSTSTLVGVR